MATDATLTPEPRTRSTAAGTRFGYTQTAATDGMDGSDGSGRSALDDRAATLPGVSAPSSVVRSMQRIARSSACIFVSRLIERFASSPARASTPTASIDPTRGIRGSRGSAKPLDSGASAVAGSGVFAFVLTGSG